MTNGFVARVGEPDEPPRPPHGLLGHPRFGRELCDREPAALRPQERVEAGAVQRTAPVGVDDLLE